MKRHIILTIQLFFVTIIFLQAQVPGFYELDCDNDSLEALPLTELGPGFYMGYQGGLFPGGSNMDPNPHQSNGKKISKDIKPINSLGVIDYINGEISVIGVGPSVASDAFNEWKEKMNGLGWPGVNACTNVKGNFIGGNSVVDMLDIDGIYWSNFLSGLASKSIEPIQVQVVWMLLVSSTDSSDINYYIDTVSEQYIQVIHNLYSMCPNLKEIFISGIHYTGYTVPEHARYEYLVEPNGYWSNLVVKNVVSMQINGDPRLKYTGPSKQAPFITWGPYFWADGIKPRIADGLSWPCDNFRDDSIGGGFHLKDEYKYKEGDMMNAFFQTNTISKIWYKNSAAWAACGTGRMMAPDEDIEDEFKLVISPSLANNQIFIPIVAGLSNTTSVAIFNSTGMQVYMTKVDAYTQYTLEVDISQFPAGIYFVALSDAKNKYSGSFIKQ